jgi:hypothetical protein
MYIIEIEKTIKYFSLYIVPIIALILSIISLVRTRKVGKLEQQIREYDAIIKKAEAEKIVKESLAKPRADIDARVTKVSKNHYKLYVFNKGDGRAYDVDYSFEEGSSVHSIKRITPFEELNPGDHFEEPAIVMLSGSGPKFKITLSWRDEDGEKCSNTLVKSLE